MGTALLRSGREARWKALAGAQLIPFANEDQLSFLSFPPSDRSREASHWVKNAASVADISRKTRNPCGFLGRMESPRLSIYSPDVHPPLSISAGKRGNEDREEVGMEAMPHLFPMRNSSLLVNSRESGWKPGFCATSSQGTSISVADSVYFSLLVLQIYNKLRKKQTSPFFFFQLASHSLPNNVWVSLKATKC